MTNDVKQVLEVARAKEFEQRTAREHVIVRLDDIYKNRFCTKKQRDLAILDAIKNVPGITVSLPHAQDFQTDACACLRRVIKL